MAEFGDWADTQLARIRAADQWREVRTFDALGSSGMLDGREVVSFASNDYLGLSTHPEVLAAAHRALDTWGAGATASRLVVGSRPIHEQLEAELRTWKRREAALVFSTGFAANVGVLSTLGGPDCLIVSDELNHASIIDGCRGSRSPVVIAGHNDVGQVDEYLRTRATERAIVVTDAVFSMDGDEAPVVPLGEVCARHGALLVIDEAHSVFGPSLEPLHAIPDLRFLNVVTLSKGLGAMGGAVCGDQSLIDLLVNRARTFVFTTGLSPADAAAAHAAIRVTRSPEGKALTDRVRMITDRLSPGHPSPIVPVIIGAEADAVAAAAALLGQGLLIPAIRPPTVAPGTSRLRIALSAAHTDTQMDALEEALASVRLVP